MFTSKHAHFLNLFQLLRFGSNIWYYHIISCKHLDISSVKNSMNVHHFPPTFFREMRCFLKTEYLNEISNFKDNKQSWGCFPSTLWGQCQNRSWRRLVRSNIIWEEWYSTPFLKCYIHSSNWSCPMNIHDSPSTDKLKKVSLHLSLSLPLFLPFFTFLFLFQFQLPPIKITIFSYPLNVMRLSI